MSWVVQVTITMIKVMHLNSQKQEDFKGQFIHPQHWPENLDYTGKKVVIIGSGATAITLVPSMVKRWGRT